jgi:hypothetical protein
MKLWETLPTVSELLGKDIPDIRHVVANLLVEGLNLLGGKSFKGKTYLAIYIAIQIATGGLVFGKRVTQGDVLGIFMDKMNEKRMAKKLREVLNGQSYPKNFSVAYGNMWPDGYHDGLAKIEEWLQDHPNAQLVIIDTLGKFYPDDNKPNNKPMQSYNKDNAAVGAIQKLASKYGIAFLVLTHFNQASGNFPRKGEDFTDRFQGTEGQIGASDACLGLFRGEDSDYAELHISGNDFDGKQVHKLQWNPLTFIFELQNTEDIPEPESESKPESWTVESLSEARQLIWLAIFPHKDGLTPTQVYNIIGGKLKTVTSNMVNMTKAGQLVNVGYGRYKAILPIEPKANSNGFHHEDPNPLTGEYEKVASAR